MEQVLAPELTTPSRPAVVVRGYRFEAVDLLRGLVMVIMALDHTRDFFHQPALVEDPLNMQTTTPILFFTRWITHFCAPVFVFLAGTSAWFQSARKSKSELSGFLIKRGLWLIFVELVIINFAFSFDIYFNGFYLQTIWSIGISMILLGLAIWLPFAAILALGSLIVLGHNALDFYEKAHGPNYPFWYNLLHIQGGTQVGGRLLFVMYPFLSWAGLMMMGYCFGKLYMELNPEKRNRVVLQLGLGVIAFFVVLRAINIYGNPEHWATQRNAVYTFLSFIDTHKYPPSLLYMCMTIGPALVFLAVMDGVKNKFTEVITVFGRVPFFFYILHFYLLHTVTSIFYLARGHSFAEGSTQASKGFFNFVQPGEGVSLFWVYVIWISVIVVLYFPCKWFSEYKRTHKQWWLSYL